MHKEGDDDVDANDAFLGSSEILKFLPEEEVEEEEEEEEQEEEG